MAQPKPPHLPTPLPHWEMRSTSIPLHWSCDPKACPTSLFFGCNVTGTSLKKLSQMVIWGHWGLPPHLLSPIHHFHEFLLSILKALVKEGAGFPHQVPDHVVVEETAARGSEQAAGHPYPPWAPLCTGWGFSPFISGQDEVGDLFQVLLGIDHDGL